MKILHLSSERSWRGGEQQIAYLIDELSKAGIENMVACRKGSAFESYCKKMGIPYHSLAFRNSLDLVSARGLKQLCQSWHPDLIHAHSSKSHALAWLADLMGNRAPLVLSRRVAFHIKKSFINKLKYNHPRLKKIICITEAVRQEVLPLLSRPDKTTLIHSGIDPASYPPEDLQHSFFKEKFHLDPNAFLIGTTAAFTKEKDYPTFLKAATLVFKELPDQPILFLAIGEGMERPTIQKMAMELGIEDRVVFTGFIPDVKRHIGELDLFFFTSRNEGLGSSILDAFASRVPAVSTDAGGIPEIIQHEATGLLAPVGHHHQLAREIIRLYRDPALREQLAAAALALVKQFDKKVTAAKTLDIYRQLSETT